MGARGKAARDEWEKRFDDYRKQARRTRGAIDHMRASQLPDGWDADIPVFEADAKGIATRDSSGKVLNVIAKRIPWLIGGAADLSPSTKT